MILSKKSYKEYLTGLKKQDLEDIINDYNSFDSLYDINKIILKKEKKEEIIKIILKNISDYFKCIVKSLDIEDYSMLKEMLVSEINEKEHKDFINYLISKKIIIKGKENELLSEVKEKLISIINDNEVKKSVEKTTKFYRMCDGIIVAYGVLDKNVFEELIEYNPLLNFYYKKDFKIDSKKVSSKELKKTEIDKLLKKKDIKELNKNELYSLGTNIYHHDIKEYKQLMKLLNEYYVVKKKDYAFIDDNILNDYLYSNNKDCDKKLVSDLEEYFEFKNDKLKDKIINLIKMIKEYFPVWNKRGYSNKEVNK